MQFRIFFLSRALELIKELDASAPSVESVIELATVFPWPPKANVLQIVDLDRKELYRVARGEMK